MVFPKAGLLLLEAVTVFPEAITLVREHVSCFRAQMLCV
jgi:hypothetical protein